MKLLSCLAAVLTLALPSLAPAGQGPAGAGACAHVIGPIGIGGIPVGFTCEDVGGHALLVWNASQSDATINVSGGIKSVNFISTDFTFDGSYTSDGSVAFIGGGAGLGLYINGSITAPSIIIASIDASQDDAKILLGAVPGSIVSTSSSLVYFGSTAKVTANSGNLVVAGSTIINDGSLHAPNGGAILKTGSRVEVGWDFATWLEGKTGFDDHSISNNGTIEARNITLEAQRDGSVTYSIFNAGRLSAADTVTFVTGTPGHAGGTGVYSPGSFGVVNTGGTIVSAKVTISPYYKAEPGGSPTNRTFNATNATERAKLLDDISGGEFFGPTQDNTPAGTSAPVIDSTSGGTSSGGTFTVTSNIVLPQLAPSLTNLNTTSIAHVNATSKGTTPTLALAGNGSEQIRGDGTQPAAPKPKARAKAKPVLVRGAFFGSKISAVITSSR